MSDSRVLSPHVMAWAETLWAYHLLGHTLKQADVILTLCSNDPRVAERGAQLFLDDWAPWLVYSGGVGALTEGMYGKPEAEHFADIAVSMGVPRDRILVEPNSTNTGENIQFTESLLAERGLAPETFIVVQKPYMERRSFATFKVYWPDKDLTVTSPPGTLAAYPLPHLPMDRVIDIMVGDLQRIRYYPAKGFQIEQEIPAEVWEAYERLLEYGFDRHLLPGLPK